MDELVELAKAKVGHLVDLSNMPSNNSVVNMLRAIINQQ